MSNYKHRCTYVFIIVIILSITAMSGTVAAQDNSTTTTEEEVETIVDSDPYEASDDDYTTVQTYLKQNIDDIGPQQNSEITSWLKRVEQGNPTAGGSTSSPPQQANPQPTQQNTSSREYLATWGPNVRAYDYNFDPSGTLTLYVESDAGGISYYMEDTSVFSCAPEGIGSAVDSSNSKSGVLAEGDNKITLKTEECNGQYQVGFQSAGIKRPISSSGSGSIIGGPYDTEEIQLVGGVGVLVGSGMVGLYVAVRRRRERITINELGKNYK